jgi:hypothetical protein
MSTRMPIALHFFKPSYVFDRRPIESSMLFAVFCPSRTHIFGLIWSLHWNSPPKNSLKLTSISSRFHPLGVTFRRRNKKDSTRPAKNRSEWPLFETGMRERRLSWSKTDSSDLSRRGEIVTVRRRDDDNSLWLFVNTSSNTSYPSSKFASICVIFWLRIDELSGFYWHLRFKS